eukprot:8555312-Alexandrium_andersonii.AAC.1
MIGSPSLSCGRTRGCAHWARVAASSATCVAPPGTTGPTPTPVRLNSKTALNSATSFRPASATARERGTRALLP